MQTLHVFMWGILVAQALPGAVFACGLADIGVTINKAEFVNLCKTKTCMAFKGAAVLTNKCNHPVAVQVKLTAYTRDKIAVATFEGWPASTRKISPGEYDFSLDTWLDYQPGIHSFKLVVIEVK